MAIKEDPRLVKMASLGVPWAVKVTTKGWGSLTTKQKIAARAALQIPMRVTKQPTPKVVRVSAPAAVSYREVTGAPRVTTAGKVLTHTASELITTLKKNTSLEPKYVEAIVNPSRVGTFNQLPDIAASYEKYKFTSLRFRYSSTCPTSTGGKVALAFERDAANPLPDNLTAFYNLEGNTSSNPRDSFVLTVPCDNVARFVADGGSDPKLVDFGKLLAASYGQGEGDANGLGEIHIEYTVQLYNRLGSAQRSQIGSLDGKFLGPRLVEVTSGKSDKGTKFTFSFHGCGLIPILWLAKPRWPLTAGSAVACEVLGQSGDDSVQWAGIRISEREQTVEFEHTETTPEAKWSVSRL
ncbi:coat protein [Cardamine chlorotic fleck virus]|uniref:Capsid protein n=1 Tax=Cardamine chlorotic fleck virus TaxID=31711 RepID=Q65990_9TOMB|nr:coat protein [Cardamine chlorotic fleck virus]AAB02619.1 coat protein [Cardamine chlorotic fleck virus]